MICIVLVRLDILLIEMRHDSWLCWIWIGIENTDGQGEARPDVSVERQVVVLNEKILKERPHKGKTETNGT